MHRLFVAIRPPASIRSQLLDIMGGVSGARWQSDEQIHLTLRFIGEVDGRQADDIHAALSGVRQAPFDIALAGLGTFDRRGEPTALWAGVNPREALSDLHRKVDQACQRAGLSPEGRAYHPHITLARLNRSSGPVGGMLAAEGGLSSLPFTVSAFHLFESHLTPSGPIYRIAETYPLNP
ncbi:RNA 2',3'-cyclic phosphodiesterase [Allosphingosinicella vermicomposti]|uniref:RNA 2',3'-cyclic phosphodiesterase n=1 Tax=Allosphingosinicella vermicomposti TaxID=614671 RepID=UPI000D11212E|nr:RNA 2',3'-cyclic phosphodiesterase [Allosphingosinicella vermicomposti]